MNDTFSINKDEYNKVLEWVEDYLLSIDGLDIYRLCFDLGLTNDPDIKCNNYYIYLKERIDLTRNLRGFKFIRGVIKWVV